LTCKHITQDSTRILVYDNFGVCQEAVVAAESKHDIAVLLFSSLKDKYHDLPYFLLAPQAVPGDTVFSGGFHQKQLHVSDGVITNSNDPHVIAITNGTNGTTGGPAVGKAIRNLYGIIKEDYNDTRHQTLLIHYVDIDNFLQDFPDVPQIRVHRMHNKPTASYP
jgi:hypothetical protein